jgi:Nicastrin
MHKLAMTECMQAAHSAYSGLISMLVAVNILSKWQRSNKIDLSHDIIFVSLTGESVDLMGSRRFLFELDQQSNATAGLDPTLIDTVIEVGMTAALLPSDETQLFVHAANASSKAVQDFVQAADSVRSLGVRSQLFQFALKCGAEAV